MILAPIISDRKGEHLGVLEDARRAGFVRVRIDGVVHDLEDKITMDRYKVHTIEVVVDRLITEDPNAEREPRKKAPRPRPAASPTPSRPRSSWAPA